MKQIWGHGGKIGAGAAVALAAGLSASVSGAEPDGAKAAQQFRKAGQPVIALDEKTIVCEAEEFAVQGTNGWRAGNWGENYYAASVANAFLSRKGFLGAPEQCAEESSASTAVRAPKAGRYLALVRYEAAYRFETRFSLRIEQNGKTKMNRLYGARDNVRIWPRFQGDVLQKEIGWHWGANENVLWEGHDARVDLDAGPATLTLIAGRQPAPAARRNVDLVMLTSDETQVTNRIAREGYLPLDGLLTQAGDLFLKVHNAKDGAAMTLSVGPGVEHSPYGVHIRDWKPLAITVAAGQGSDWTEVGSLLDSLNDGQWTLLAKPDATNAPPHYMLEFGAADAAGKVQSINTFESRKNKIEFAYDANTRYTKRIRPQEDALYDLLAYLKANPVRGKRPERTQVWGYTFDEKPEDARYMAALNEFRGMYNLRRIDYEHAVGIKPELEYLEAKYPLTATEKKCKQLQAEGKADKILLATLGDEIGLPWPPADDHAGFRAWLKAQNLTPAQVDPTAGNDWEKVLYSPKTPTADVSKVKPALHYYSMRYGMAMAVRNMKPKTDLLRGYLPNASIGANYSPHAEMYLGQVYRWVTLFREGGMTTPWSEDYIWQPPVGSQQMNFLNLDLFRAGLKGQAHPRIIYYVMTHWPGNNPESWRRQFYGDLAHGMNIINLFEFRPVQAAYTENYNSLPEMYLEVRKSLYELGTFEDIVQDGRVRPGLAALWFSETGDIWEDQRAPFGSGKKTLNLAIRHQQLPTDVVVEQDALAGDLAKYRFLYLADQHVGRVASAKIAEWVAAGGLLFATAGAGMFDEFNAPNMILRQTLGVEQTALEEPKAGEGVFYEKQDLPFAQPIDTVTWNATNGPVTMPVINVRSRITADGATVQGTFKDGSPAITVNGVGKGRAIYCAFLPGLSYFKPAIPLKPVTRTSAQDSMTHFIPTAFDRGTSALVGIPAAGVDLPVQCSEPLVENSIIEAPQGAVIPLINWSAAPVSALTVTVRLPALVKKAVTLASGKPLKTAVANGTLTAVFDLDVADALILR